MWKTLWDNELNFENESELLMNLPSVKVSCDYKKIRINFNNKKQKKIKMKTSIKNFLKKIITSELCKNIRSQMANKIR